MTQIDVGRADGDTLVARARAALQQGNLNGAVALCEQALDASPRHVEAIYTSIVARRYQRRFGEALLLADQLLEIDPGYGRAYQEIGHCRRDMGDNDLALQAYQRAIGHNPALVASWKMLADLHLAAGRREAAALAKAQFDYLDSLPPELQTVSSLIAEKRYVKAERLCRAYLQAHGHHVEAMRLLADIGTRFNSYDEAEFLLESAMVLDPEGTNAHLDYVKILRARQKYAKALEAATALRAKAPGSAQFEMVYANENLAVGNFDLALGVYEDLLADMPANPGLNLTYGHALKTVGAGDAAIEAYRRACASRPDFGDAYWSLANLKTYRFLDSEIEQMRAAEAAPGTRLDDRYHLCFALGKALEDRGDPGAAFACYERGNRLKKEELRYDPERIAGEIRAQIAACTPELFDRFAGSGCKAADPIFIVGLPRAGSTLLEQILASHSQVEGTMELPNILALAHKLDGRRRVDEEARYPANLAELADVDFIRFGEAYLADTQIYRKAGTPFFIDKMPNNFRHIGLIHLILPNARIIDARRGAMGCCFSGFKQLFAEGQEFTYGLEEIGRYYRDYVALMDHWDRVLPGKVLRVRYEDVVGDLEPQVRRLLDFCGLPFEAGCLDFHSNERAVRTPSSEQVRQPIFRSGIDQWEHFSPYLDPLRAVLGPELSSS